MYVKGRREGRDIGERRRRRGGREGEGEGAGEREENRRREGIIEKASIGCKNGEQTVAREWEGEEERRGRRIREREGGDSLPTVVWSSLRDIWKRGRVSEVNQFLIIL